MRELMRRARHVLRRRQFDADLAEEMAFHRDMAAQELEQRGASAADAATGARRTFGSTALAADQARDVWVPVWLRDIAVDLEFAARRLAIDPRFTIGASLALGLGIGANLMVFTFINSLLFREVPFDHSEQLVWIQSRDSRGRSAGVSYLEFEDLRASLRTFDGLSATAGSPLNLSDEDRPPERVQGCYVSANAFALLRTPPTLGRGFLAEDDRIGAPPVIVIGHDLWVSRYGSDPAVVGSTIRVNGTPTTVVGVMPVDFRFPLIAGAWQPIAQFPGIAAMPRDARMLNPFGRLANGATFEAGLGELNAIAARLAGEFPTTEKGITIGGLLMNKRGAGALSVLYTLMGAVGFVLLIACANVANLLLARAARRARELAIRSSLGATRWRLVRQLLLESLVLAGGAGIAGYAFSVAGVRLFAIIFAIRELGGTAATMPYWLNLSADGRVLAFLAGVCLLSTVLFGLAPALHVSKTSIADVLKDGGKGSAGPRRSRRWTAALLVAELALTLILLAGTGLLVRSFVALYRAVGAVESRDVVTARIALPAQKYATPSARLAFFDQFTDRLGADAAIDGVAVASELPFMPVAGATRELTLDGHVAGAGDIQPSVSTVFVTPKYFALVGLPVVRGRTFTDADGTAGQATAIVNQRFASMYFPDADPIGRRFRLTRTGDTTAGWLTVIGVSADYKPTSLDEPGPIPAGYVTSYRYMATRNTGLMVRTTGAPAQVTSSVRAAIRASDPTLPVFEVRTMAEVRTLGFWAQRLFGWLFALFGVVALVLATVGVYGVIAYGVSQRTREIGVRVALGAQSADVIRLVVRNGAWLALSGIAIGLLGAFGLTRVIQSLLTDVSSNDPLSFAGVTIFLACVALLASYVPARRATKVDPLTALRAE